MMSIRKLNKEVGAWGLALAMGISTFLIQSGTEKHLSQTDAPGIDISSTEIEKQELRWHTEEPSAAGLLLDNSLSN